MSPEFLTGPRHRPSSLSQQPVTICEQQLNCIGADNIFRRSHLSDESRRRRWDGQETNPQEESLRRSLADRETNSQGCTLDLAQINASQFSGFCGPSFASHYTDGRSLSCLFRRCNWFCFGKSVTTLSDDGIDRSTDDQKGTQNVKTIYHYRQLFVAALFILACPFTGCDRSDETDERSATNKSTVHPVDNPKLNVQGTSVESSIDPNTPGEISGKIILRNWTASATNPKVSVSYRGIKSSDLRVVNNASMLDTWMAKIPTSQTRTTFQPRNSQIGHDPETGFYFKHEQLPPGTYCFVFGCGRNRYRAIWREIKPGDKIKLDVELDFLAESTLQVQAAPKSKVWINFSTQTESAQELLSVGPDSERKLQAFDTQNWSILCWNFMNMGRTNSQGELELRLAPGQYRVYVGHPDEGNPIATPISVELKDGQTRVIKTD